MDIEIMLDTTDAKQEDHARIEERFQQWYAEGSEVRYDKACFGRLTKLEQPFRYRLDLGQIDALTAVRDLHARLHRFGVKVFIHFLY